MLLTLLTKANTTLASAKNLGSPMWPTVQYEFEFEELCKFETDLKKTLVYETGAQMRLISYKK
jgi:hypothetical protein